MQFRKDTVSVIENFSEINQGMVFQPGNQLKTMSVMKNIFAEATIKEEIPVGFAIYELKELLNVLSFKQNAEIEFKEDHIIIKLAGNETTYFFSNPDIILSPGNKKIQIPSKDLCFRLSEENFCHIMKVSNIMRLRDVEFSKGKITIFNRNVLGNKETMKIETIGSSNKKFLFKVENLRMMQRDYDVCLSEKGFGQFITPEEDISYWIAMDSDE